MVSFITLVSAFVDKTDSEIYLTFEYVIFYTYRYSYILMLHIALSGALNFMILLIVTKTRKLVFSGKTNLIHSN